MSAYFRIDLSDLRVTARENQPDARAVVTIVHFPA